EKRGAGRDLVAAAHAERHEAPTDGRADVRELAFDVALVAVAGALAAADERERGERGERKRTSAGKTKRRHGIDLASAKAPRKRDPAISSTRPDAAATAGGQFRAAPLR